MTVESNPGNSQTPSEQNLTVKTEGISFKESLLETGHSIGLAILTENRKKGFEISTPLGIFNRKPQTVEENIDLEDQNVK